MMATFVQEEMSSRQQVRSGLIRPVLYIAAYLALPLVLYFLPFLFVRTQGFIRLAGSQFSPALDYSFRTAGQNADVVVYGDSSAFYGLSPVQISHELGIKVINLPNTGGSLPVVDDLPLRYYLSVNAAPKLIVFYLAPWNLDYAHAENRYVFEGEEVLLRHGSLREIIAFAKSRPSDLFEYPFKVYSTGPQAAVIAVLHRTDRFKGTAANGGVIEEAAADSRKASAGIKTPCSLPARCFNAGFGSVQIFRARYANKNTQVLVFVAPVPSCDNVGTIAKRDYSPVLAAPPNLLPPDSFRDDKNYVHLNASAVAGATSVLSNAIKQALARPGY